MEQENTEGQAASSDVVKDIPLAATDGLSEEEGDIPNGMQESGEEVPVNIDLDALQEAVAALEAELNEDEEVELSEDEEIELTEEDLAAILSEDDEELNEEEELEEAAIDTSAAQASADEAEADENKSKA